MNYIFESLFVGAYTWFIYMLVSPFIKNFSILLLVTGFSKHFLGSGFQLHDFYCNNGDTCIKVLSQDQHYKANTKTLIRDSLIESILFLSLGSLLGYKLTKGTLFFVMGVLLHIMSRNLSIQKYFCKTTCEPE